MASGLVRPALHCRPLQRALVDLVALAAAGDLPGPPLLDLPDERRLPGELPHGGVLLELLPRVGDVEVANRQLTDPVDRPEGGVLGALHGELVRVVAQRRTLGAQDRVVLAAAQAQG